MVQDDGRSMFQTVNLCRTRRPLTTRPGSREDGAVTEQHSVHGWRTDMENAPHNVSVLLAWQDWRDGQWCMEIGPAVTGQRYENGYSSVSYHGSATHWQPRPAPPFPISIDGGVQGSIATKQATSGAERSESELNFALLLTVQNVAKSAHAKSVDMSVWHEDIRALDWAVEFIKRQLTPPSVGRDTGKGGDV